MFQSPVNCLAFSFSILIDKIQSDRAKDEIAQNICCTFDIKIATGYE